jgi:hypothetical protein
MPTAEDDPATCGRKVMSTAEWAANHSNYDTVVAYGYDTGGQSGYNDTTAAGAVAAFLIIRGQHWLFSIGVHDPCNPRHYPVTGKWHSDYTGPCHNYSNKMNPDTAALTVSDYGKPLGKAHELVDQPGVFAREFEKATVTLDCSSFTGTFVTKV